MVRITMIVEIVIFMEMVAVLVIVIFVGIVVTITVAVQMAMPAHPIVVPIMMTEVVMMLVDVIQNTMAAEIV